MQKHYKNKHSVLEWKRFFINHGEIGHGGNSKIYKVVKKTDKSKNSVYPLLFSFYELKCHQRIFLSKKTQRNGSLGKSTKKEQCCIKIKQICFHFLFPIPEQKTYICKVSNNQEI